MLTAAKPKKRSRLALPRPKGVRNASNGSATGPSVATPDLGGRIPSASSAGVAAAAGASPASSAPLAVSAAGLSSKGDLQATAKKSGLGHGPGSRVAREGQPQVAGEEEGGKEKQQEGGSGTGCRDRGNAGERPPREPLQAVSLNGRREVTAAAAAATAEVGRSGDGATAASTAAAAIAAVAAAASEASLILDGLQHVGEAGCRASEAPPPPPPPHPVESESRERRTSRDPLPQPSRRKRPRPPPPENRPTISPPRARAPPPPKRERPPTAECGSGVGPSPALAAAAEATAESAAEEVAILDGEHEVAEDQAKAPTKPGRGTTSERCSGGENGVAERRPGAPPSPKTEAGPAPPSQQRERCPVCCCAVWGLNVRARQVSLRRQPRVPV